MFRYLLFWPLIIQPLNYLIVFIQIILSLNRDLPLLNPQFLNFDLSVFFLNHIKLLFEIEFILFGDNVAKISNLVLFNHIVIVPQNISIPIVKTILNLDFGISSLRTYDILKWFKWVGRNGWDLRFFPIKLVLLYRALRSWTTNWLLRLDYR